MPLLSIPALWSKVWPILVAIFSFLIIIMIHEFGHFIIAKIMGVKVNEYAIGFGPTLFKWKGKETQYSLRLLPFGGFCSMEGEDSESEDPRGFCNKRPWRRLLIVLAGAVFNIILGFIIVFISLLPSELLGTTKVAQFVNNDKFTSVSDKHGLKVNDEIISVDGRRIFSTIDLGYAFSGVADGKVDMVVIREGKKIELKDVQFAHEEIDGVSFITPDFNVYGVENNFGNIIVQTGKETLSYSRMVWFSLVDLIGGKFGISQVSGPVGVTAAISDAVSINILNLLPMMALITINLGIFNLLPIPSLDGSRALFILIEMITRKKIPKKYEAIIHAVGIIILFAFLILITIKDIVSFF